MSLAFVFPGQGSQSVGMLAAMAADYVDIERTFAEASEVLGFDLWQLVQNGPEDSLNKTTNTQPAMLAAGVAVWRVWQSRGGPLPDYMAGHSLGEYTALVCARAIEFKEAVQLVADRGRFMQEAVPIGEGAMAAIIGLDDDAVRQVCEQVAAGDVVAPVNFNAPGQVVVAGATAAVERVVDQAKSAGARRAVLLPVSGPFHSALMHPAVGRMAERLRETDIRNPKIPVIHNSHVETETDPTAIRNVLVQQIESPVRWVETIQKMIMLGVNRIVECGPGKVLAGLNKRIARDARSLAVSDTDSLAVALSAVGGDT
ncbi:MAG: ACP S-malonyltransferase [Proteobacteria bacterium]|nr:MAG: ACP S-malonyltransferase [Pseudomonadota bacterium]